MTNQVVILHSAHHLVAYFSKILRLLFSLNVAPELFIKQIEKYFGEIEGFIIYFDDILIAEESIEQHEEIM